MAGLNRQTDGTPGFRQKIKNPAKLALGRVTQRNRRTASGDLGDPSMVCDVRLVFRANLRGLHARFGFRLGLVDAVVDNGGGRGRRLCIHHRALLGRAIPYHIELGGHGRLGDGAYGKGQRANQYCFFQEFLLQCYVMSSSILGVGHCSTFSRQRRAKFIRNGGPDELNRRRARS